LPTEKGEKEAKDFAKKSPYNDVFQNPFLEWD
jgi:hypothetical protein